MIPPRNLQYFQRSSLGPVLVGTARSYEEGVRTVRNTDMALYYDGWYHNGVWDTRCPIVNPPVKQYGVSGEKHIHFQKDKAKWRVVVPGVKVTRYFNELEDAVKARDAALLEAKCRRKAS